MYEQGLNKAELNDSTHKLKKASHSRVEEVLSCKPPKRISSIALSTEVGTVTCILQSRSSLGRTTS